MRKSRLWVQHVARWKLIATAFAIWRSFIIGTESRVTRGVDRGTKATFKRRCAAQQVVDDSYTLRSRSKSKMYVRTLVFETETKTTMIGTSSWGRLRDPRNDNTRENPFHFRHQSSRGVNLWKSHQKPYTSSSPRTPFTNRRMRCLLTTCQTHVRYEDYQR